MPVRVDEMGEFDGVEDEIDFDDPVADDGHPRNAERAAGASYHESGRAVDHRRPDEREPLGRRERLEDDQ